MPWLGVLRHMGGLRKCLSGVEYVLHVTALRKDSREGRPCCLILLGPLGSVEPEMNTL